MSQARRRKRWGAAFVLGFSGAAIIALAQRGVNVEPLVAGARQRGQARAEAAGGARAGSIMETTVLALAR